MGSTRLPGKVLIDLGGESVLARVVRRLRRADLVDEIAVATCLERMAHYVETGESFYGLSEASQDHYLSMVIAEAAETGKELKSSNQVWS